MENAIITTTALTAITNPQLKKATKALMTIGAKIAKCNIEAALIAAKVAETKCYEDDGFKTAADWLNKTLGISTASAYNMIRVGTKYIDETTKETILPHETGADFNVSQVIAMLPLNDVETAQNMVADNEITVDMSVREIKKIVAAKTSQEQEQEQETEEQETEDTEETEETVVRLWVTAAAALETLATYYASAEGDNSAYQEIMTLYRALNTLENVIENGGETH